MSVAAQWHVFLAFFSFGGKCIELPHSHRARHLVSPIIRCIFVGIESRKMPCFINKSVTPQCCKFTCVHDWEVRFPRSWSESGFRIGPQLFHHLSKMSIDCVLSMSEVDKLHRHKRFASRKLHAECPLRTLLTLFCLAPLLSSHQTLGHCPCWELGMQREGHGPVT